MKRHVYEACAIYADHPTELGAATEMGEDIVNRTFNIVQLEQGDAIARVTTTDPVRLHADPIAIGHVSDQRVFDPHDGQSRGPAGRESVEQVSRTLPGVRCRQTDQESGRHWIGHRRRERHERVRYGPQSLRLHLHVHGRNEYFRRASSIICIGSASTPNLTPSLFEACFASEEQAQILLEHQSGTNPTQTYLRVFTEGSKWHAMARIWHSPDVTAQAHATR